MKTFIIGAVFGVAGSLTAHFIFHWNDMTCLMSAVFMGAMSTIVTRKS